MSLLGMSIETWLSIALGAVVSIGLFLLQIRRAASVQKERIARANNEIVQACLRVFASFRDHFDEADLDMLIASKARSFGVKKEYLNSPEHVLEDVYVSVMENEYLKADERAEIKGRIVTVIDTVNLQATFEEIENSRSPQATWPKVAAAVFSLCIGAISTLIFARVFDIIGGEPGSGAEWSGSFPYIATMAAVLGVLAAAASIAYQALAEKAEALSKKSKEHEGDPPPNVVTIAKKKAE